MKYSDAGVNIDAGNQFVKMIKKDVEETFSPAVLKGIGGFAALYAPNLSGYKEPVLVSGTDGVGTKLKIAFMLDKHDTVGIDLVAMCVNDILTIGARPLFFLDYLAVARLETEKASAIVSGIARGCKEAGCALIGGETAEMPGFYQPGEYDLAGFAVGIVDREKMITGDGIEAGDKIIGLASSGLHSNGYSLARKVFLEKEKLDLYEPLGKGGEPLGEILLSPTRIYVRTILKLMEEFDIKGLAHITGGGLLENVPRILPEGLTARIEKDSWPVAGVFRELQRLGGIAEEEMYRTFNMGVGMVVIVRKEEAEGILEAARALGEEAYLIGEIIQGDAGIIIE
ncbi:MAG: phosphoribosylformylglycinamidine cyclo-ligase [Halanaerobiales bacterium]